MIIKSVDKRSKKKAQIFSIDLMVASGIFVLILISAAWAWDYSKEKIALTEKRNDMEVITRVAISTLVETEGNPSNWSNLANDAVNSSNVYSLGLAESTSINGLNGNNKGKANGLNKKGAWGLDQAKITKLGNSDYENTKVLLGVMGYEFELGVNQWNGSDYINSDTIGLSPYTNITNIVKIERFSRLGDQWALLSLKLWEKNEY